MNDGRQRGLGDAQQQVAVGHRDLAVLLQGFVGVEQLGALDLLASDVGRALLSLIHI